MPDWDLDTVRYALSVAREHGFSELELSAEGNCFQAKLGATDAHGTRLSDKALLMTEPIPGAETAEVTAALVGYYQPADPPLAIGQRIGVGEIVAVITALGLANDVESSVAGEVIAVLVQEGDSVQYGQPLAQVRLSL